MATINIQRTLENPRYRNWVKAGLSLKVTRDGIQYFVDDQVQTIHQQILANICRIKGLAVGTVCNMCTTQNVIPCPTNGTCSISRRGVCNFHDNNNPLKKHRSCTTGICGDIYVQIKKSHRFNSPSWHNTNAQDWCRNSWEVAKCFLPRDYYVNVTSAAETDFTGLLSVVINLKDFQNMVKDNLSHSNNIFCQVRNLRNQIMHTSTFELSVPELDRYIDTMIQLLNDAKYLAKDVNAQNAITKLNQIKNGFLTVTAEDETKIRDEALQAIDEKKKEVLNTIEEKAKQHDIKKTAALDAIGEKVEQIELKKTEALDAIGEKKTEALDAIGENKTKALDAIGEKKTEALDANEEKVEHIELKKTEALDAIGEKKTEALDAIGENKTKALDAIGEKKTEAIDANEEKVEHIELKKIEALDAIGEKKTEALDAIGEKKTEALDANAEKVEQIELKKTEALDAIGEKKTEALDAIGENKTKALDAIGEKKRKAQDANEEKVEQIELKKTEALDAIGEKKTEALDAIGENKTKALDAIGEKKTEAIDANEEKVEQIELKTIEALDAIGEKKTEALDAIGEKKTEALDANEEKVKQIEVKKTEALDAIGEKKTEALDAIGEKVKHIDVKKKEALDAIEETAKNEKQNVIKVMHEQISHIEEKKGEITKQTEIKKHEAIESIESIKRQKAEQTYINDKKVLQTELIQLYRAKYIKTSVFPRAPEEEDTDIDDIYVTSSLRIINTQQNRKGGNYQELQQKSKGDNPPEVNNKSLRGLFYKNSHQCKNIYITGDAGIGKTTLCKQLISTWCSAHSLPAMSDMLSDDEKTMLNFHFLFYISLRHAASDGDIENMIKNQLLLNPCHILEKEPEKCLIILDGLDEWTPPKDHHEHLPYVTEGLPSRTLANKCSILTTTRPWKLEVLRPSTLEIDQQVELLGLNDDASEKLIDLVVANLNARDERIRNGKDFKKELQNKNLGHLTTIPVILKQLICLWHEGKPLGESQCLLYSGMINLLFERAEKRLIKIPELHTIKEKNAKFQTCLPKCFDDATECQKFCSLLYTLSKLAFETLFSPNTESSLVFESSKVEVYGLSKTEIDVCLNVGILSQSKVNSGYTRKKSLSFLHKTFQEFLASVFVSMSSDQPDIVTTICNICNSVFKVFEMSKIFVFISGMSPKIVYKLSEHIWKVASDVTQGYRQSMGKFPLSSDTIIVIHDNMIRCVKESSDNGYQNIKLKLEDIIIHGYTSEMIHFIHTNIGNIKSVYIDYLYDIPSELIEHLTQVASLQKLCIPYKGDPSYILTIVNNSMDTLITLQLSDHFQMSELFMSELILMLNKLSNLRNLSLSCMTLSHSNHAALLAYVSQATQLQHIRMQNIVCLDMSGKSMDMRRLMGIDIQDADLMMYLGSMSMDMRRLMGINIQHTASLDLSQHQQLQYLELIEIPVTEIVSVNTTKLQKCVTSNDIFPSLSEYLIMAPNLQEIAINNRFSCPEGIDSLVKHLPNLEHIKKITLNGIDFGEKKLQLSHKMKHLESVVIIECTMTSKAVCSFVDSIPETQHSVKIMLDRMFIIPVGEADKCVEYIKTCPRFVVIRANVLTRAEIGQKCMIDVEFKIVTDRGWSE